MDNYFQLRDELGRLPGYRVLLENEGLNNSIYIFDKNFAELKQLLDFTEAQERVTDVLNIDGLQNLRAIDRDMLRLLHNYVASAISLVDHTRRIYRLLFESKKKFQDYNEHISELFTKDPLSQFVKYLRQYCQHYKAPNINYVTMIKNGETEHKVCLNKASLLLMDGWSAIDKKYLEEIEENVYLTDVIENYRNKVISFYEWFQHRYFEVLSADIAEYKSKETMLLTLQLEMHLAMCEGDQPSRRNPYHMFSYILPDNYNYIRSIPKDNRNRIDIIMDLLTQRLPLSESIKERIKRVLL